MRIVRTDVVPFALPFRPGLDGFPSLREGLLLRLESVEGLAGFGEASPAPWAGGETVLEARRSLERIRSPVQAGADAATLLSELTPSARCALDAALLDLAARAAGTTVAARFGGSDTELEVAALLRGPGARELATEAAGRVAEGYRVLKLKVGGRPLEADCERVAAVRSGAGEAAALRLDANRGWSPEGALGALGSLSRFGIELVEEPLRAPLPRDLARLRRAGVPVALDESVSSIADLERFLEADAADALVLKAARVGGPTAALALARIAGDAGLRVVVTDSIETAVGQSVTVHLGAAIPAPRLALGLGGAFWLAGEVSSQGRGPRVRVRGPGLGVTPDLGALRG